MYNEDNISATGEPGQSGPAHIHEDGVFGSHSEDALWDEMFASCRGHPVAIPVLADNTETSGAGGDLVRHRRRLRVRIKRD